MCIRDSHMCEDGREMFQPLCRRFVDILPVLQCDFGIRRGYGGQASYLCVQRPEEARAILGLQLTNKYPGGFHTASLVEGLRWPYCLLLLGEVYSKGAFPEDG